LDDFRNGAYLEAWGPKNVSFQMRAKIPTVLVQYGSSMTQHSDKLHLPREVFDK